MAGQKAHIETIHKDGRPVYVVTAPGHPPYEADTWAHAKAYAAAATEAHRQGLTLTEAPEQ